MLDYAGLQPTLARQATHGDACTREGGHGGNKGVGRWGWTRGVGLVGGNLNPTPFRLNPDEWGGAHRETKELGGGGGRGEWGVYLPYTICITLPSTSCSIYLYSTPLLPTLYSIYLYFTPPGWKRGVGRGAHGRDDLDESGDPEQRPKVPIAHYRLPNPRSRWSNPMARIPEEEER